MPSLHAIPFSRQREEPWASGAGSTRVLLREPDRDDWTLRISIAKVEHEGPFSEFPDTRRLLVPLDAPMALRFPDGHETCAARMDSLRFDGMPAPIGLLPGGPTRDFNLMLRGDTRAEVLPRTLVDSMTLPSDTGLRWLVYLDSGRARIAAGDWDNLALEPGDAALIAASDGRSCTRIAGAGEIVLVKLYA